MFRWLRILFMGVRGSDWAELHRKLTDLELDHSNLKERFGRFQNQMAMRYARDVGQARDEALRIASATVTSPKSVFDELE